LNHKNGLYKITFWTSILVVAGIVGGLATLRLIGVHLETNLSNSYARQEETIAQGITDSLEAKINSLTTDLNILAGNPGLQTLDTSRCLPVLRQSLTLVGNDISNLGRVGPDGIFYCSINSKLIGSPAANLGDYVPHLIADPEHRQVISRAIQAPGLSDYLIAIHVPVKDENGTFVGTLGGAFNLTRLGENYLSSVHVGATGNVFLQDDDGTILYAAAPGYIGKNYFSPELQKAGANIASLNSAIYSARAGKSTTIKYNYNTSESQATIVPVDIIPGRRWVLGVSIQTSEINGIYSASGLKEAFYSFGILLTFSILLFGAVLEYGIVRAYKLRAKEDEFVSLASHQLRTPATAVKNYIGLLKEGYAGKLTPEQEQYVNDAYQDNERQLSIITNILDVAKTDAKTLVLNKESVDMTQLLRSVGNDLKPTFDNREQKLQVKLPEDAITAVVDPLYVRMIVENLLSNASKYTPRNGNVVLQLTSKPSSVQIRVRDSGLGISSKNQKRLFKKFSRIHNELSVESGGTGIGLYLVHNIVKLHKGSIDVASAEGKGSSFIISLPKGLTHNGKDSSN
jgi:signal transduction histidine kinase